MRGQFLHLRRQHSNYPIRLRQHTMRQAPPRMAGQAQRAQHATLPPHLTTGRQDGRPQLPRNPAVARSPRGKTTYHRRVLKYAFAACGFRGWFLLCACASLVGGLKPNLSADKAAWLPLPPRTS